MSLPWLFTPPQCLHTKSGHTIQNLLSPIVSPRISLHWFTNHYYVVLSSSVVLKSGNNTGRNSVSGSLERCGSRSSKRPQPNLIVLGPQPGIQVVLVVLNCLNEPNEREFREFYFLSLLFLIFFYGAFDLRIWGSHSWANCLGVT